MFLHLSKEIPKKIIDAYERNIKKLSVYQTGHFFTRAFKITGNERYGDILFQFMLVYEKGILSDFLSKIKKGNFEYKAPEEKLSVNQRIRKRYLFYEKKPKVKLYLDVLQYLIYVDKFNLYDFLLEDKKSEFIEILKKEDFAELFITKEAMETNGSYIFNSLAILKKIGVCDLTGKAIEVLKDTYFNKDLAIRKNITKDEAVSMLYSLTHIVIADTLYYEKYCNKYGWLIDFFAKNIDFVMKNSTDDVLTEVGLCFKLCRKEDIYQKEFKKIKKKVLSKLSLLKLKNKSYIAKKEHTVSLMLLLFAQNKEFFKGPNLSKHRSGFY